MSTLVETELSALRERAYGPHADIDGDPAALARLIALENAHAEVVRDDTGSAETSGHAGDGAASAIRMAEPPSPPEPVAPPRASARPPSWGAIALILGVLAAVAGVFLVVPTSSPAVPDVVLRESGDDRAHFLRAILERDTPETDDLDLDQLGQTAQPEIDPTTLRGFGDYAGVDLWAARDALGSSCVLAVSWDEMDVVAQHCVPGGAEVFVDVPRGSGVLTRFILRGDELHAYRLEAEEAD